MRCLACRPLYIPSAVMGPLAQPVNSNVNNIPSTVFIYGLPFDYRQRNVLSDSAMAMRPAEGVNQLAQLLGIDLDEHGFAAEAHRKMQPVASSRPGIFLAGCAQAPRDIPETIAHASAAAAMVCASLRESEGKQASGSEPGRLVES